MKEKVIIFIIGLLSGAIISTGVIYFCNIANNSNNSVRDQRIEFNGKTPPRDGGRRIMPNNNNSQNNDQLDNN